MRRNILSRAATSLMLIVAIALVTAPTARAKASAEQKCQNSRHTAAAKYAQCEYTAMAKFFAGGDAVKLQPALSKCRVKYTGTWPKLQKAALGTGVTCDADRFVEDAAGVTDNLTGLQWEFGGESASITWDGAYGSYLQSFNGGPSCSPHCDWRLPTRAELQTILSDPFPCATSPCAAAVFTSTVANFYWTSTTDAVDGSLAWVVNFDSGLVGNASMTDNWSFRAVRGGL